MWALKKKCERERCFKITILTESYKFTVNGTTATPNYVTTSLRPAFLKKYSRISRVIIYKALNKNLLNFPICSLCSAMWEQLQGSPCTSRKALLSQRIKLVVRKVDLANLLFNSAEEILYQWKIFKKKKKNWPYLNNKGEAQGPLLIKCSIY